MRLVKNIVLSLLAFIVAFVVFMPREQLYYYLEKELNKQDIVISNEKIESKLGSLIVTNGVVYAKGVEVARFSKAKISPFLVINQAVIEDIELLNIAKKFLDIDIEKLKAKHTILNPFIINLDANGSFGVAKGFVNLKQRVIHIDIVEAKNIAPLRRFLTKGEKGWQYESSF